MKLIYVLLFNAISHIVAATDFRLDGHYLMTLQMANGGRIFKDELILKSKDLNGHIWGTNFNDDVRGMIIVPNVFSSPLTGRGSCNHLTSTCAFNFEIQAHENNQYYKVYYEMKMLENDYEKIKNGTSLPRFVGEVYLEDHSLLGTFEAILENE